MAYKMKTKGADDTIDQKVKPGAMIGASIEIAGNGGCLVRYDHSPDNPASKDNPYFTTPRRPDAFNSIEEACHAIVQAAGGNSELEEAQEADEGKAA